MNPRPSSLDFEYAEMKLAARKLNVAIARFNEMVAQEICELKALIDKLGIDYRLIAKDIGMSNRAFFKAMREAEGGKYIGFDLADLRKIEAYLSAVNKEIADYLQSRK